MAEFFTLPGLILNIIFSSGALALMQASISERSQRVSAWNFAFISLLYDYYSPPPFF
jgi:hypothetical protein